MFSFEDFEKARITNDLVFNRVMGNKKNCLRLLQAILPELHLTKIVKIETQKVITLDILVKGVRLDIWAQDNKGHIFDLEMQNKKEPGLFKRAEFYASRISNQALKTGHPYQEIKSSYVIFLCSFDPFGYNEARYDLINVLRLHRDREIQTGKNIIFLNSKARHLKDLLPDLVAYLQYMNGIVEPNNKFIFELEKIRNEYINGKEWQDTMIDFKTMQEEMKDIGRKQGVKDSINKFITFLKQTLDYNDTQILATLEKQYGNSFSKKELENMIKKN